MKPIEVKLVILGDTAVGKSSLLARFVNDRFDVASQATIGASFMNKSVLINNQSIRFQIWDTGVSDDIKCYLSHMTLAGAERYHSLARKSVVVDFLHQFVVTYSCSSLLPRS